jgi:hypothetical protein
MNEFWAALAGAVVGGLITAVTSWRLLTAQWKREDAVRHEQAIWNEFENIHEALRGVSLMDSRLDHGVLIELTIRLARLGNIVEFSHPALYLVIDETATKLLSQKRATWQEGVDDLLNLSLNWLRERKSLGRAAEPPGLVGRLIARLRRR